MEKVAAAGRMMPAIAEKLYAWGKDRFGTKAVQDVFTWRDGNTLAVAFYGDALAQLNRFGMSGDLRIPNRGSYLDESIARALGIPTEVKSYGVSPQFFERDSVVIDSFLQGVGGAVSAAIDNDGSLSVRVTLIQKPGYPFTGAPTPFYSAKSRKVVTGPVPPWAIQVTSRDRQGREVQRLGLNFCALLPAIERPLSGYGAMDIGGQFAMLTHAFSPIERDPANDRSKAVAACGGLLFPSLAIGPVPALNFGSCAMVVDPMVALDALKPYKNARGAWPVAVYNTDTWTTTTRDFVGRLAADAYDQLTGRHEYSGYDHIHALGPSVRMEGSTHAEGGKLLRDTKSLAAALRARFKIWKRDLTVAQMTNIAETRGRTKDKYAYLEVKVNSVLSMRDVVAAFVPSWEAKAAEKWLRNAGFTGRVVVVKGSDETRRVFQNEWSDARSAEHARYQWAWTIHDAARQVLPTVSVRMA